MLLDELQHFSLHQAFHDAPLLDCERVRLEHALQVRQRVEHENGLVPRRPQLHDEHKKQGIKTYSFQISSVGVKAVKAISEVSP